VTMRPRNDHFTAHKPSRLDAIDGSTTPWEWPWL
jgi:hypothetical protein